MSKMQNMVPKSSHEASDLESSRERSQSQRDSEKFSFACEIHPGEEYVYYQSSRQRLLCAHCLLTEVDPATIGEIRSIKKCLPEIANDFQSVLDKIDLRTKLLQNKRFDFEIRREHSRKESAEQLKRLEMNIDEIIEFALELKNKARRSYESRIEELFSK